MAKEKTNLQIGKENYRRNWNQQEKASYVANLCGQVFSGYSDLDMQTRNSYRSCLRRYLERESKNKEHFQNQNSKRYDIKKDILDLCHAYDPNIGWDDKKRINDEAKTIEGFLSRGEYQVLNGTRFRSHKVPVDGEEFTVIDAKTISRLNNQSGRGPWRYLFRNNKLAGLAKEKDSGAYGAVWRKTA
jgi:hypothetical protein